MTARARIALVGSGMMGCEHIRNLALFRDRAEIVGLMDPEPRSLRGAAAEIERSYGEGAAAAVPGFARLRDLLAETKPDAAILSSPNHTHAAALAELMAAGVAILAEKPLATTLNDALRLRDAAAAYAPLFWVGMEYRFMPPVARFVEQVHKGRPGRTVMLSIREHRFPFLRKVGDWNRFARNTGGTMVEKCCHFFDLMRLILRDEPSRVFCSGSMDVNHRDEAYGGETPDILDNAFTIVDFRGGARAMLDLCMFAEGAESQEEISAVGDLGRLDVAIPGGSIVWSPRAPKGAVEEPVPVDPAALAAGTHHGATYYQQAAFLDALASGGRAAVTAEDGLRAVAMGIAAEISARERRAVAMAELGL